MEVITTLKNSLPPILMGYLTKDAYRLIDRMDLYMNCKLYINPKSESEFKKYVNSILSGQIKNI